MGELPHFHHDPTTSFLHSQPIETPPSGSGLICAAGQYKCSFGMIPLSRYSVDRSPWAFHSSTHNVVRGEGRGGEGRGGEGEVGGGEGRGGREGGMEGGR